MASCDNFTSAIFSQRALDRRTEPARSTRGDRRASSSSNRAGGYGINLRRAAATASFSGEIGDRLRPSHRGSEFVFASRQQRIASTAQLWASQRANSALRFWTLPPRCLSRMSGPMRARLPSVASTRVCPGTSRPVRPDQPSPGRLAGSEEPVERDGVSSAMRPGVRRGFARRQAPGAWGDRAVDHGRRSFSVISPVCAVARGTRHDRQRAQSAWAGQHR
jgi:hypothetical protein